MEASLPEGRSTTAVPHHVRFLALRRCAIDALPMTIYIYIYISGIQQQTASHFDTVYQRTQYQCDSKEVRSADQPQLSKENSSHRVSQTAESGKFAEAPHNNQVATDRTVQLLQYMYR